MTPKRIMALVILAACVVALLILNPFVVITPGERGVLLTWGKPSDTVFGEGLHFRMPIVQNVVKLDVRTLKHEVQVITYSRDIQTVDTKVALNFHLAPDSVNRLLQEVGKDYLERIIDPAIQESVKAATAKFTAEELIGERPKVKEEIRAQLITRLQPLIAVDEFSIVNFDFSDAYEKAVEEKQVAQQRALQAKNDLLRIKTEAEQQIERAKAQAETIRIQAEAVTQQGGRDYVQLQAIAKWDGKLPVSFVPGSAVPFLNLGTP